MELTDELKSLFVETAQMLKSSERRIFMAQVVKRLGKGGQRRAEQELGWNRRTIRLGMHELESGFRCVDAFSARGRKRAEEHLPNLLADIDSILEGQSQAESDLEDDTVVHAYQRSRSAAPTDGPEKVFRYGATL